MQRERGLTDNNNCLHKQNATHKRNKNQCGSGALLLDAIRWRHAEDKLAWACEIVSFNFPFDKAIRWMCVSMAVWLCGEWRLLNVRGHFGTASTVGPFVLGSITHYRVVTRTRVYRIGYVCLALIERRKKIEQQHRGQAICPQNFIVAVVVVYFVWRFFLYIFFICHTLVRVRLHNDEREMHELSERVLNEKRQRWKYGIHKNQLLEFGVVCCWSRCFSFSRISPFGFIVHKCVVCCVLCVEARVLGQYSMMHEYGITEGVCECSFSLIHSLSLRCVRFDLFFSSNEARGTVHTSIVVWSASSGGKSHANRC